MKLANKKKIKKLNHNRVNQPFHIQRMLSSDSLLYGGTKEHKISQQSFRRVCCFATNKPSSGWKNGRRSVYNEACPDVCGRYTPIYSIYSYLHKWGAFPHENKHHSELSRPYLCSRSTYRVEVWWKQEIREPVKCHESQSQTFRERRVRFKIKHDIRQSG